MCSFTGIMKLQFEYDIDMDVKNIMKGKRSVNNKKPTRFQNLIADECGEDFDDEDAKIFIKKYVENDDVDVSSEIDRFEKEWKRVESDFTERVEKMFGMSYPSPVVTVYLSHNQRSTYNIAEDYFFVMIGSQISNQVVMHELLHFYTWHAFGKKFIDDGLSKSRYNEVKESLTELLNVEFSDLMDGEIDKGYPQHTVMREKVREMWLEKKDVRSVFDFLVSSNV